MLSYSWSRFISLSSSWLCQKSSHRKTTPAAQKFPRRFLLLMFACTRIGAYIMLARVVGTQHHSGRCTAPSRISASRSSACPQSVALATKYGSRHSITCTKGSDPAVHRFYATSAPPSSATAQEDPAKQMRALVCTRTYISHTHTLKHALHVFSYTRAHATYTHIHAHTRHASHATRAHTTHITHTTTHPHTTPHHIHTTPHTHHTSHSRTTQHHTPITLSWFLPVPTTQDKTSIATLPTATTTATKLTNRGDLWGASHALCQ